MNARELMTPNPTVVTPSTSIPEAARKMREIDVGFMPVVESEGSKRPVGVITDRDIVVRHVAEGHEQNHPVEKHMTSEVVSVGANDSVEVALRRMKEKRIRRLVVTDGDELVGVIAQADVAMQLGPEAVDRVVGKISQPAEPQR